MAQQYLTTYLAKYYHFIIILDPKTNGFDVDELFANEDYTAIYEAAIQTIHRPQYASCEIFTVGNYDKKQAQCDQRGSYTKLLSRS